jgi:hypothetical protein
MDSPVSFLDEMRELAADLTVEFGSPAVLTLPAATSDAAGEVVETPVDYSVIVAGPVDEAKRWSALSTDMRITATFYVASKGLSVVPTPGCRITYQGRRFVVAGVTTFSVQGGNVAFRADCGEVGTDG